MDCWLLQRLFALLLASFAFCARAQSTAGITGIPDTSYSTYKEYEKLVKIYPFIKPVLPATSPAVVEKKGIAYCTTGNRKLLLDAFHPASSSKSKPAVVIIHGGGWRSGNPAQHRPLAQRLAALGYVCFTPEYRLSTDALYPAAVHDLKAALRWVRAAAKTYGVDTGKIAVAGFSAGGQLAALLGTTANNPAFEGEGCYKNLSSAVQAVVDMDGTLSFVHPESGEGDDSKRTSAATHWFGYPKQENPELWRQASPLTHAGPQTPPTLFINSSVARMHAGRDDYLKILDALGTYTAVKTFEGAPHSFPLFQPWFDSTVAAMDAFLKKVFTPKAVAQTIVVAPDGSGQYKTVQAALNAVPANNQKPVTVFVKAGVYKEKLRLHSTKRLVTLVGEDKFKTVLTYDDHTGKIAPSGAVINTRTSWSFLMEADDFTARNITFQNDAGFSAGQAVAVEADGDRARFFNCRFVGNQDVLFTDNNNSRQYYEDCYVEGTTDFIFGSSTVWFERCHIHSKKNSHVTAAATPKEKAFGYVFNDCVLTGDTSLQNASLGRPWQPHAQVAYLRCYIGPHVRPEGWSVWNKTDNHLTAQYFEYGNYGPGAAVDKRLPWTKRLSDEEAKRFALRNVLGEWRPLMDR